MLDDNEKIEKIGKIEKEVEAPAKQPARPTGAPNKEQFDALLQKEQTKVQTGEQVATQRISLMEAVRDASHTRSAPGKVSPDQLIAQTKEAIQTIEGIKEVLKSPDISVKTSAQQLLHNKLQHIDDSLRIALSKTGVEFNPTAEEMQTKPARVNPIERFLGFLTDGQWKLENLGSELRTMSLNEKELSPVDMLAVQVKVTQIQQELELFSSLLNKGLESIKTIMNIQV